MGYRPSASSPSAFALMTMRNLPDKERRIWQAHFDHFVFSADDGTWAHIPEAARGLLAPDEVTTRRARAQLLSNLKR